MTMSYEEAVRLLTKATENPITISFEDVTTRQMNEAIRALLSAPEPSEEEVLAVVSEHVRKDFGVLKVGIKALVQGVQQLYRSRRNG